MADQKVGDFEVEVQKILHLAQLALAMEIYFDTISRSVSMADTFGPILDPTRWMNSTEDYRRVGDMAEYLRKFTDVAEDTIERAKERKRNDGRGN